LNATGPLSRTSIIYPVVIPAGATVPIPAAGTMFYVTVTTSPIGLDLRPLNGVFNRYGPGKGLQVHEINAFSALEARNPNTFAIVAQIFVGFDEFIDRTLILSQTGQTLVAFPTYATPSSATNVNITDLSGSAFSDINGGNWYALQREGIYVFNPDAGVTLLLQQAGSVLSNGPAIGVIYPQTSLRLGLSGNYCLNVGGGNINAIVTEIYQAIPAQSI